MPSMFTTSEVGHYTLHGFRPKSGVHCCMYQRERQALIGNKRGFRPKSGAFVV